MTRTPSPSRSTLLSLVGASAAGSPVTSAADGVGGANDADGGVYPLREPSRLDHLYPLAALAFAQVDLVLSSAGRMLLVLRHGHSLTEATDKVG